MLSRWGTFDPRLMAGLYTDDGLTFEEILPRVPRVSPDAPPRTIFIRVNGARPGTRKFSPDQITVLPDTIIGNLPYGYADGDDSVLVRWLKHNRRNIRPDDVLTILGYSAGAAVLLENADNLGKLGMPINFTAVDPAAPWYHPLTTNGIRPPAITREQAARFKNFRVYSSDGNYLDLSPVIRKTMENASLARCEGLFPTANHIKLSNTGHLFNNYGATRDGRVVELTPGQRKLIATPNGSVFTINTWSYDPFLSVFAKVQDAQKRITDLAHPRLIQADRKIEDINLPRLKARFFYELGRAYSRGHVVTKDASRARYYLQKAAELDNTEAQFLLGCMYYIGDGVSKDPEKAIHWFRKASEMGNAKAKAELKNLDLGGGRE